MFALFLDVALVQVGVGPLAVDSQGPLLKIKGALNSGLSVGTGFNRIGQVELELFRNSEEQKNDRLFFFFFSSVEKVEKDRQTD